MTLLRRLGPALFAVFGTVMAFHPMVLSGLARMETDPADARHLNYVLEHGYQWIQSRPGHTDFWSPPVFFPEQNTAAYSETLLGVLPFYLFWRFLGFPPDTSLQLWTLTVSLLNFAAAYLLIRRLLLRSALASCLGAFVFSFGSPRIVHSQHHHLLPQFFTILVVASVMMLIRPESDPSSRGTTAWIAVFFASLVAQFYACFYLAWMLVLSLCVAGVIACLLADIRVRMISLASRRWPAISAGAAIAALALAPLAEHYLKAASAVGYRNFDDVAIMLPTPGSWFNSGPYSWLYAKLWRPMGFADMPYEGAKRLGAGLITTILAAYGLFCERKRPGVRVLLVASAALIVIATMLPGGYSLWRTVYDLVPGAKAIRAVGRLAFVLLIPVSIGIAYALDRVRQRCPRVVLTLLAALVVVEQGQTMPSYDKQSARGDVERIVRQIPRGCESFFVAFPGLERRREVIHVDAMWASLEVSLPTVNGYSSNLPPGWFPLFNNQVLGPGDRTRIRGALDQWLVSRGRDPSRTCLVTIH